MERRTILDLGRALNQCSRMPSIGHWYLINRVSPHNPLSHHLLLREHQFRPDLPATHLAQLMPHLDRLVYILAKGQRPQKPTGKHVACAVGINDFLARELGDRVGLWIVVGCLEVGGGWGGRGGGDEGGGGALGDDDETRAGGIGFGEGGEGGGDLGEGGFLNISHELVVVYRALRRVMG